MTIPTPPRHAHFWGKAQPDDSLSSSFHPLACHLLDVAAVATSLLELRPTSRARAARLLDLPEADVVQLLGALAGLHDIGKFAPRFQAKAPDCWPTSLGRYDPAFAVPARHTDDGYVLWCALAPVLAPRLWSGGERVIEELATAVFGHHGRPVQRGRLRAEPTHLTFRGDSFEIARDAANELLDLLMPGPLAAAPPSDTRGRLATWWLAGFLTIADWIASRERWFPYAAPEILVDGLDAYWQRAKAQAARAVVEEGLAAATIARSRPFRELVGHEKTPTPVQLWAERAELPVGPSLVIIEDVTGSGKTEAAQMLVHRFMARGAASGAYWAMPTQATANAMYDRQAPMLTALFERGEPMPSLVLAHGQRALHDRFRDTVVDVERRTGRGERANVTLDDELTSTVACSAFFADDRRAAMLADVGAGTVDQALLGALPSKFNTVRLFGLAEKVLVIDEAHAYDPFTSVELCELLRFHAALGGSAVVLSATLSHKQREGLVRGWMEGLIGRRRRQALFGAPARPEPLIRDASYPLATVVGPGDSVARETPLRTAAWSHRAVDVRFLRSAEAAQEHVVALGNMVGAVAWVRNTVDDCLASAAALRARGLSPIVFHARFAQGDRQRRERDVLARFGPNASAESRRGAVLVATQVVEQSLDLDFDAMVSDLAPVDLLVQRAGRLWRHPRRSGSRPDDLGCELTVLAPTTAVAPTESWITSLLPGTARVYANTGVLWRTVEALEANPRIVTPGGLRALIEQVYGTDDVPGALQLASDKASGAAAAAAATANIDVLKFELGYDQEVGWMDELRAVTRLSDVPTTTVRLARVRDDGRLEPWERDADSDWKAWALSEVRLRATRVPAGAVAAPEFGTAIAAVRARWGKFEQDIPVLPLVEVDDGVWRGTLVDPERAKHIEISYGREEGLRFVKADRS